MNDRPTVFSQIPLEAIAKGRDLGEVLTAYMTFHKRATAVYRLYLLGVEDGMKRG